MTVTKRGIPTFGTPRSFVVTFETVVGGDRGSLRRRRRPPQKRAFLCRPYVTSTAVAAAAPPVLAGEDLSCAVPHDDAAVEAVLPDAFGNRRHVPVVRVRRMRLNVVDMHPLLGAVDNLGHKELSVIPDTTPRQQPPPLRRATGCAATSPNPSSVAGRPPLRKAPPAPAPTIPLAPQRT